MADETNQATGQGDGETHDKAGVMTGDRGDAKALDAGGRRRDCR